MRLGLHAPTKGATDTFYHVADALQASVFCWLENHRPADAMRFTDAVHIVRLPNPQPQESAGGWWSRVAGIANMWMAAPLPADSLLIQPANEPEQQGYDLPTPWTIADWKSRHTDYLGYLLSAHPNARVLAPPFTCANTKALDANYVAPYFGVSTHCYFAKGNPGWRQGIDGGAAWLMATAYGKPVYITELGCNPQDAGEILAWLGEAHDQPLLESMCLFLPDAAGTEFDSYNVTIEMAAAIRAGTIPPPVPDPPPPPEPQPMNPYAYDGDYAYRTFTRMVAGALSQKNPSVMSRENYLAVHAAAKQKDISVATLLGWIVAENVDPDLIAVNNLAGIYYVGQSRATPGPLGPANEGGKPYCAFATLTDFWATLAVNIETIDPDAWNRGDLRSIARTYTGGAQGYAKVDIVDALRDAGAYPHGTLEDAPAPSSGVTGEQIAAEALTQLNHVRSGDYDTRNGDHPWYLWCESFVERVHEHCGLTVAAAISAADQGRAMEAAGRLHRNDPNAPRGAVHFWDEGFWADGGHTGISLGDGTFVGTVSPEGVGIRSGWQGRAGYMGWAFYPGVGEAIAPVEEIDMLVETGFDPGILRRQWDGPKTKAAIKKVGSIDPNRAIDDKWIAELKAGRPLGFAISNEEGDPASGRVVRFFANGRITFFTADGSVKVN
jgi:hypothetical protein